MPPAQDGDPLVDIVTPRPGYGQVIFQLGSRTVIRLDENRAVKTGSLLDGRETEAMAFIAAHTTIPVPKIYDTLTTGGKHGKRHIVMEYMEGESLDKVWRSLSLKQKEMTCRQLGGYISQLQQLKGGSCIQAANGEAVKIILGSSRESDKPFNTMHDFNDWLVDGVFHRITPPRFMENCRAALSDCHDICFAHGDFAPRNILVDDTGNVTAILDWELAGWFPAYWDIGKVLVDLPEKMPDYRFYLHHIVPFKYPHECLAMHQLECYYPPVSGCRHASLFFHELDQEIGTILHAAGLKFAFAVETKPGYDPRTSARLVHEVFVGRIEREIPALLNIARQAPVNNEDAEWNCLSWVGEALTWLVNANVISECEPSAALDKMVDTLLEAMEDQPL